MANRAEMARFRALRQRTMRLIERELEIDPHCKSYEGTFEIKVCYPSYFEDGAGVLKPNFYVIELLCYVLGAHRHYEWTGDTFGQALDKAEAEIAEWGEEERLSEI